MENKVTIELSAAHEVYVEPKLVDKTALGLPALEDHPILAWSATKIKKSLDDAFWREDERYLGSALSQIGSDGPMQKWRDYLDSRVKVILANPDDTRARNLYAAIRYLEGWSDSWIAASGWVEHPLYDNRWVTEDEAKKIEEREDGE
jgi:hypothetical protein